MNKPLITLCVLAYNRPKDLENSIRSFLFQNYENSEMIIIDDNSPTNLSNVVSKWIKNDKRIKFYRNKKNLGLAKNFSESFKYCKGEVVIFLGDDDIFIEENALKEYADAFGLHKELGVLRSRQVIIRNSKLYQVSSIGTKKIEIYNKGKDSFDNFVTDTISIAGDAYRNDKLLKSLNSYSESVYPQVELAARVALFRKTGTINQYLIGVGSGENQLNVLSYKLNGVKTTILEDLYKVFSRTNQLATRHSMGLIDKDELIQRVISYVIILLPYDSLKNGRKAALDFAGLMLIKKKSLILSPLFAISIGIVIMPNVVVRFLLKIINKIKLNLTLSETRVDQINKNVRRVILEK